MPDLRFDDRVAIVTGAGRGLAREHALLLAKLGAKVVVNDLGTEVDGTGSSQTPAQSVVEEITAAGGTAVANTDSVASSAGAQAIVDAALSSFGRIYVVVNNAGVNLLGAFEEVSDQDFRRVIDILFYGTVNVSRAAWPHLKAAEYGRVVNTASHAFHGWAQLTAYSAGKAAVLGLTRSLAAEGTPFGVKVNALAPAGFTRMTSSTNLPQEQLDALPQVVWLHTPSLAAAYLAHETCALNGELISVCGPRVGRLFVAETRGFFDHGLSVESVAASVDQIIDEKDYPVFPDGESNLGFVIGSVGEELA